MLFIAGGTTYIPIIDIQFILVYITDEGFPKEPAVLN